MGISDFFTLIGLVLAWNFMATFVEWDLFNNYMEDDNVY